MAALRAAAGVPGHGGDGGDVPTSAVAALAMEDRAEEKHGR